MSVIERAKAHYEGRRELSSIEVKEWEATVYYYPAMTLREQREILEHQGNQADAVLATLMVRARDEDGQRMFKSADRLTLQRHTDADVISDIVIRMSTEEAPSGN